MLQVRTTEVSFPRLLGQSRSARTCLRNYEADRLAAAKARTNQVPDPLFLDQNGNPTSSHSIGGVFYLSELEVKNQLIGVMDQVAEVLPANALFRTPFEKLHITGLVHRDLRPTPFSPEEIERSLCWILATAELCAGMTPPVFSLFGINLTKNGVIYGKAYPHTDDFQTLRDRLQERFPESRYKDVYNVSLGRIYRQLSPKEFGSTLRFIETNHLKTYLGTVKAKTLSINHHDGLGLIAQGKTLSEVNF